MRLTSISITNLAGFSGSVTFQLSAVSLIQGNHGAGKSSLLDTLAYAFGRRPLAEPGARGIEHDPAIIHGNEERGEAVINFDDDSQYRVLVTATETTRQIKVPGEKRWNRATPQLIDSLVNALSYDPFKLKTLTEKQRVEALLGASPVEVTEAEIMEAVGDCAVPRLPVKPSLEAVNAYHQHIYELRRTENVAADTQRKHAEQLQAALPPETPDGDWSATAAKFRTDKERLDESDQSHIEKVRKTLESFKAEQTDAHGVRRNAIDVEINDKIAALEAERRKRIEESSATCSASIEEARAIANKSVTEKRAEINPERERLTIEIATAEERALATAQVSGTRKAVEAAQSEAMKRKDNADKMTAALERLTALKESVAGKLAIPGITIASPKAGLPVDICRDEKGSLVPFSRWNEADKDTFCLRMAVLLHGKCGVVFVDEIGHLTPERKKALLNACRKYTESGMQWILAEAQPCELRVVNWGGE